MKTTIAIIVLSFAIAAYAAPGAGVVKRAKGDGNDPNCGLKKKTMPLLPKIKAASVGCEICLDLVQVAEMFAECEEAFIEEKLDEKCDEWTHSTTNLADHLCRAMIETIAQEIIAETGQPAPAVCQKLFHITC